MEKYSITYWLGQTIPFEVEWDTDTAATAKLIIYYGSKTVFEKSASFVGRNVKLDITPTENASIGKGEYTWLIEVTYSDGSKDIIPPPNLGGCNDCEDGCDKPQLIICSEAC